MNLNIRNEFAVITLVIPVTASWPRPDKSPWEELVDHDAPILVRSCDYVETDSLSSDEVLALRTLYDPQEIYAATDMEHVKADSWFWQIGDRWVAVAGEQESDWFLGIDMPGEVPDPRTYPVVTIPSYGTLVFRDPSGNSIEIAAELFQAPATV